MTNTNKTTIYILECDKGKYYVGRSNNVKRRTEDHFDGKGSQWTQLYPPKKIIKTITNASVYDEDRYVIEYMELYGIDNVRGGSYSNIELYPNQHTEITKKIRSSKDLCFRCGSDKHFISDCGPNKTTPQQRGDLWLPPQKRSDLWLPPQKRGDLWLPPQKRGDLWLPHQKRGGRIWGKVVKQRRNPRNITVWIPCRPDEFSPDTTRGKYIFKKKVVHPEDTFLFLCFRCDRLGHTSSECYAKTNVKQNKMDKCYNCGREDHYQWRCGYSVDIYGRKIQKTIIGTIINKLRK